MRGSSKVITQDMANIESFLMEVEIFFKDELVKYDEFLQIIISFQDNSCRINMADVLRRAKYLFKENMTLLLGLNQFLPRGYEITDAHSSLGMEEEPPAHLNDKVCKLVDDIKIQLKDDVFTWNRFLDTLNLYRSCSWNIETTLRQLGVIFKDKEYFLKHFDFFSQNPTTYLDKQEGWRETLHKDQKSFDPSSQSGNKVKLLGDSRLLKKGGHSKITPSSPSSAESSSEEINDAEEGNDVVECDYSTHSRVTPSYVLLPENDQVPKIEKPDDKYLNSHCISVASLDRRHCFKSMHHNKDAKELFVYEDKRFEMDITISSMESAIERAKKRLAWFRCKAMETTEPDPLSVRDLRLVEGKRDRVLELREILRDNEAEMLPSILQKLKQKKVKWEEKRSEFNKEWSKAKLLRDSLLMKKDGRSKSTPSSPSEPSSVEGNNDEEINDISELDHSTNLRISPEHRLLPKNDQVPEDELLNSKKKKC